MRELSEERRQFYQNVVETCKADYENINAEIERLITEARERVNELNQDRKSVLQVFGGACRRLGVDNEFRAEEEEDDDFE